MTTPPYRIAVVGVGKIARDRHLPAIRADPRFELVAVADPNAGVPGVPGYASLAALLADGPPLDAVALCTPPVGRSALAIAALEAGLHVLVEKPPAATLAEIDDVARCAAAEGRTLFAAWHSREAGAIAPARAWLAGRRVTGFAIQWREDIRRWHPGQDWILGPGGYGVFDPGINALSIATAILPGPLRVIDAAVIVPAGRQSPISARLRLACATAAGTADFDFLKDGEQQWDIVIDTDAGQLAIRRGGAVIECDGTVETFANSEYPRLYTRFAELIRSRRCDVDASPLALAEDALTIAERRTGPTFRW